MLDLVWIILLLLISLAALLKGADYLVEGGADIAKHFRVSPILIGLTIVAFGTSLPEFMVSLFAGLVGSTDLSIGNIVGSNIFNIAVVIGLAATLTPLLVRQRTIAYEFPFLVTSAFLLVLLSNNFFILQRNEFILDRWDGVIFLGIFAVFLYYVFLSARRDRAGGKRQTAKNENTLWKNGLYIILGLAGLLIGGRLFTYAATRLAAAAGLSEAFIGLTIAAVGTSAPELFTSAVAAWRKQNDIAVGNIIGSNIFNILFVLGITSVIKPLAVGPQMLAVDGMVMIFVSLLFLFFAARYKTIGRFAGITLLLTYAVYFAYLVWRL